MDYDALEKELGRVNQLQAQDAIMASLVKIQTLILLGIAEELHEIRLRFKP